MKKILLIFILIFFNSLLYSQNNNNEIIKSKLDSDITINFDEYTKVYINYLGIDYLLPLKLKDSNTFYFNIKNDLKDFKLNGLNYIDLVLQKGDIKTIKKIEIINDISKENDPKVVVMDNPTENINLEIKKIFNQGDNILNDAKLLIKGNIENTPNSDPDQIYKQEILKRYNIDYGKIEDYTFLKHLKVHLGYHRHSKKLEYTSNIAKTDVTNFATGMARFLADRAKQELNESFFIQMHKHMERIPELQVYFPESYKFLKRLDANTMSFDLEYLKNRFEKDIKLLPNNILEAINQADETKFPYFRTANHYLNHNINGLWINIGLQSVMHSNGNINPKDLLYHFVHSKGKDKKSLLLNLENKLKAYDDKIQINLINSIKLAELVSNSLLSPETGRYWVSSKEINDLICDEKLFHTYIGLLLAKSEFGEYKVIFNEVSLKKLVEDKYTHLYDEKNNKIVDENLVTLKDGVKYINNEILTEKDGVKYINGNILTKKVNADLGLLKNLILEIYQTYQTVEDQINDLKTTKNNNELADKSYEAFGLVKTSVTKMQTLISKNEYLGKQGIVINTDVLTNYIDPSVEVAYNLFNKKYNLAIKNFVHILNQVPSVSKFMSDYDLINLIEKVDAENLNKLNGQKLITTFLQQKDVRQSLINSGTLNEKDIDDLIKNGNIDKTSLLKLVKSKEKEINTFLKDNKEVKAFLENQSKDYNKFISKFSTYGTLIANVATAQNSDEVKAAIEASVLPVGSSRIKRHSDWSITANAFVGGFYGKAFYKEQIGGITEKRSIDTFGITAPIGVSFNKGNLALFNSRSVLGINLQLIDLGSLVNFYMQEGDGASLPRDTKIQLGDIIAPGGSISYSIGDTPFTLMGGVQYVPTLSRMETISTNNEFKPLTWRVHIGLVIDIPLFNLKVWN